MKNNHHKHVTKEELEQSLSGLEQRMDQKMDRFATREELAKAETHIVCWVVGLFLGTVVLIGTLVGVYATLLLGKL
ncbi:MAG: hypothetical protein OXU50_07320 [Gammaproteobacteria bacterium]|nr:hypothetical protein [Gammaproteobacteria bacterium]MDD9869682.1 hypothetical protein [Gammaproteobacteria bacterium]MDD9886136.1 hypothetical protein [Gammaproteobacteria bacterium]